MAADESVFAAADAIRIVKTGCADVINIKTMKSGLPGGFKYIDLDLHSDPASEPFAGGPEFADIVYHLISCGPEIGVSRKQK